MEENRLKKAIEDIRNIRLTKEEKSAMFQRIMQGADAALPVARDLRPRPSPFGAHTFGSWFSHRPAWTVASVVLIVVLLGGGVAGGAEKALPGQALYAVKVKITEPLRDAFLSEPVAKAEWQIEKAERRLVEAEVLAEKGELTETAGKEIKELLSEHSDALGKALVDVRRNEGDGNVKTEDKGDAARAASTAEDIGGRFSKELDSHADKLERIEQEKLKNAAGAAASGERMEKASSFSAVQAPDLSGEQSESAGIAEKAREKADEIRVSKTGVGASAAVPATSGAATTSATSSTSASPFAPALEGKNDNDGDSVIYRDGQREKEEGEDEDEWADD